MSSDVVHKVTDTLFIFHCPACGYGHHIDTKRWQFNGDLVKPTVSPSLLVNPSNDPSCPKCHSYVRDGKIEYLSDCTHEYAGQTIPLPVFDL